MICSAALLQRVMGLPAFRSNSGTAQVFAAALPWAALEEQPMAAWRSVPLQHHYFLCNQGYLDTTHHRRTRNNTPVRGHTNCRPGRKVPLAFTHFRAQSEEPIADIQNG